MRRCQHEIKREARSRGIKALFHFTRSRNAGSILRNGLLSRHVLSTNGIPFLASDRMRLDGNLEAVSVSVHAINSRMFYEKRREYDDEWLIFVLNASILWTHDCQFCWTNAASNEIRRHYGRIDGPWAFRKMFEDRPMSIVDASSRRVALALSDFEPTDEAAEVQVFEPIAPELILGVFAPNHRLKLQLEGLMQSIDRVRPVRVEEEYFR